MYLFFFRSVYVRQTKICLCNSVFLQCMSVLKSFQQWHSPHLLRRQIRWWFFSRHSYTIIHFSSHSHLQSEWRHLTPLHGSDIKMYDGSIPFFKTMTKIGPSSGLHVLNTVFFFWRTVMRAATVRVNVQHNEWEEVSRPGVFSCDKDRGSESAAESGRYREKGPTTKEYGSDEEKYSSRRGKKTLRPSLLMYCSCGRY